MPHHDVAYPVVGQNRVDRFRLSLRLDPGQPPVPEGPKLVFQNAHVRRIEVLQFAHDFFGHRFQGILTVKTADAAVQENQVVHANGYFSFEHPVGQFALRVPGRVPGLPVLYPAQRMLEVPLIPVVRRQRGEPFRVMGLVLLHLQLEHAVPQGGRIAVDESLVLALVYITQIAVDVHGLVVANQRVHAPALAFRLLFELAKVFDDLKRVGTAIRYIAGLHQVCLSTGPLAFPVHQPGESQRGQVVFKVTVKVTDRDDALDAYPLVFVNLPGAGRGLIPGKQRHQQRERQ